MLVVHGNSNADVVLRAASLPSISDRFDPANPFESIEAFSNHHTYLSKSQKNSFAHSVRDFFVQKAYCQDETVELPPHLVENFSKIHLATLLGAIEFPRAEKLRMLATIEKVTGLHFTAISKGFQICQLEIATLNGFSRNISTGWTYLAAEDLKSDMPEIPADPEGLGCTKKVHLVLARQIYPKLQEDLSTAEARAQEALSKAKSKAIQPSNSGAVATSRWFDAEKPFESIARFSDRFSVLSPEEQQSEFMAIHDFFITKAIEKQVVDIPSAFEDRFTWVDLKFLTGFLQDSLPDYQNKEYERHRLIAAIQKVTEKRFVSLDKEDQIYQTNMKYDGKRGNSQPEFSSWLKAVFAEGSKLVGLVSHRHDALIGCFINRPIELEGMNPLLAFMLQRFQYPPVELDAAEATEDRVKSAIELLVYAKKLEMSGLEKEIAQWIRSQKDATAESKKEISTLIATLLTRNDVYLAIQEADLGLLEPDVTLLSDEVCYNVLRQNFRYLNASQSNFDSIVDTALGTQNSHLDVLIKYRKEQMGGGDLAEKAANRIVDALVRSEDLSGLTKFRKELLRKEIDKKIGKSIQDHFVRVILTPALQQSARMSRIKEFIVDAVSQMDTPQIADPVARLDALTKTHGIGKSDSSEMSAFFKREDVRKFFEDTENTALWEVLSGATHSYHEMIETSSRQISETFKAWKVVAVGETVVPPADLLLPLQKLMEAVGTRYQDKKVKVEKVLGTIERRLFSEFIAAAFDSGRELSIHAIKTKLCPNHHAKFTLSVNEARKLVAILANQDVIKFFGENGFAEAGQMMRQLLETHLVKVKIEESRIQLIHSLWKDMSKEKLDGIESLLKEFKSVWEFSKKEERAAISIAESVAYHHFILGLLEARSFAVEPKEENVEIEQPGYNDSVSDHQLKREYATRRFIETYIGKENGALRKFMAFSIDHLNSWRDSYKPDDDQSFKDLVNEKSKEFDEKLKTIWVADAQMLLKLLSQEDARKLFADPDHLKLIVRLEKRLNDYIASKPLANLAAGVTGFWS